MDFENTFKENRQTLLNLARSNSLKCGNMIPTEDFYSQGCEIFIRCFNKYKPEKAQFNTYFIGCCKGFFKGMIVKETIRQINHVSTRQVVSMEYEIGDLNLKTKTRLIFSNNDNLKNTIDPEHRVTFMDRLSKLSGDAIEVVMLVLKTPSDFVDDLSKSTIRSFLMKRWKGNGRGQTAQDRVKFAFNEIKETLNDF
jgi:hypothetical protein